MAYAGCSFDSPCPTSCPNGYVPGTAHTMDGCTVYCMAEPVNGQCQEGGSGCESSCYTTVTKGVTKNATEPMKISPFKEVSFKSNVPNGSDTCSSWCPSDHWCSVNGVCCSDNYPVACGASNAEGYCCPAGHHCCEGNCCQD